MPLAAYCAASGRPILPNPTTATIALLVPRSPAIACRIPVDPAPIRGGLARSDHVPVGYAGNDSRMPTPVRRRISHYAKGLARYGPTYLLEGVGFWLIIEPGGQAGYGPPRAPFLPPAYPPCVAVILPAAMP